MQPTFWLFELTNINGPKTSINLGLRPFVLKAVSLQVAN